ncbi:hypothetical protein [Priestia endophytica]|nr:hypothetical protein [Priestia endophytica]
MIALFFAQRVILGKTPYREVPSTLKIEVKDILAVNQLDYLAIEE